MMNATSAPASTKEKFLSQFIGQDIPDERPYEQKIRDDAQAALNILEFPTARDEDWKYTRVAPIIKGTYTQEPAFGISNIDKFRIPGLEASLLVFINGFYSAELSDLSAETGCLIEPMARANAIHPELIEKYYGSLADHKSVVFTALNTVYNTNGFFIFLEEDAVLEKPVHILNIAEGEGAAFNPRNLVIAGRNSNASIISTYETLSGSSFTNAVTEIVIHENAILRHHVVQNGSQDSKQVNTIQVGQEASSKFTISTVTLNGGLIRNNLNIAISGEGCETNLYGLYLTARSQHIDNHTFVDHRMPNCRSNELYKGVMNEHSTGVFNGKVMVRKDAQNTNAFQSNQNILLSDDASVYSKPELEIYADDVKCSHGSTTGQIDDDAIFYLRSRGIPEKEAKSIMIRAFAADVLGAVAIEPLQALIEGHINKRFQSS